MNSATLSRDILLSATDLKFHLQNSSNSFDLDKIKSKLLKTIEQNLMIDFFQKCVLQNLLKQNNLLVSKMKVEFEKQITKLKIKLQKMKKEEGEVEVRDIKIQIAEKITLSKDKLIAVKEWESIDGISTQRTIDNLLSILRIAIAFKDPDLFNQYKMSCLKQIENSGDWDRRNRFFVYQALHYIQIRNFKEACTLLLNSIPSFIATEIISFSKIIQYAVLIAIFQLPRVQLKIKVLNNPEILNSKDCLPFLFKFLNSFYDCRYNDFFMNLLSVMTSIKQDPFLEVHSDFLLHQYRFIAYEQFLRPYKSVKLENMSKEFGLSKNFLEKDLCNYISEGTLHCEIDTVDAIVIVKKYHADDHNYRQILKKGDYLINLLQKLSQNLSL